MVKYPTLANQPENMKDIIYVGLDEMFKALEESFADLSDDQIWANELPNRHNIGTLVLHVQENIDRHACKFQIGRFALVHEDRFAIFEKPLVDERRTVDLPSVEEILGRHYQLRDTVVPGLADVGDKELLEPRAGKNEYWWQQHRRNSIQGYMRVIWHANAHLRQIWAIRGAMGAYGPNGWPHQYWH